MDYSKERTVTWRVRIYRKKQAARNQWSGTGRAILKNLLMCASCGQRMIAGYTTTRGHRCA